MTMYDLIVLGSGTAGVAAAGKCAEAGWRVALADPLPLGGTCALRGCDPKKILRRGAEVVDAARLLDGRGIAGDTAIDWGALQRHKRGFTDPMPGRIEEYLESVGVDVFHAAARFTGRDEVEIDGERLRAQYVLVATGARPRPLDIPGADLVSDSTAFLSLDELPKRILFIGGGFISFEFAHIAQRAGSACVIAHRHDRPLAGFDPGLIDRLVAHTADLGVDLRATADVTAISSVPGSLVATLSTGEQVEADLVVHGAGRIAHLDSLDLDAAGVAWSERGVEVADHLQSTTNPHVFAAGDAADTAGRPLTPIASTEGALAASNMLEEARATPDYRGTPTTVFTIPELTRVGMLEDEAREAGYDVRVSEHDTGSWFSNYRVAESTAGVRIVIDTATDRVLGAHLLGPEYAELVNLFAMAIRLGLTTEQLSSVTMSYPSVGSDLSSML
ncbi:NAD(P)/FAD-dependent oxidoreductase [Microbacterium sp. G2-8]|uniref:dihydrolipoyl dehydrogenase family protein n=1 Tax=Microbacterium sp. G2-8 TaxID=2842454 RepID=UPI001C8A1C0D|nr:NAD(P)/FAD-dependent oxidoreductase [Microbacterium sp. G2-8]